MAPRQQFNVSLSPDLVRRVKHRAVDDQLSLSDLVERALEAHLARPDVVLAPMVHVAETGPAVDFLTALGAALRDGSRDGDFARLGLGDAEVTLLAHPPNPEQGEGVVELNFTATGDLAALEERVAAAGVEVVRPTTDEGFGRQLQLRGPDGLLVKVNELEPALYG